MHMLRNTAAPKLLVLLFLAIIPAIAIALASPAWLGHDTKTHAAPTQSVTQQRAPALPPAISQGVSVHGVPAWEHDGYRGSTIKIGIIDSDFKGFTNLMGTELPPNTPILTRVYAQCYTAMGVHTANIGDCEDACVANCKSYVGHGTSMTLSWRTADDETVTGYRILRKQPGQEEFEVHVTDTANTETQYIDTVDVDPDTRYEYMVQAINAAGVGPASNAATVQTPAAP